MATFVSTTSVDAPPERVFALLTDWPAHARWVPLTQMRVLTEKPGGVGARFVARSGIGRFGFDDLMEITQWAPPESGRPGRCTVVKLGRLVKGGADLEVRAGQAGGSDVTWTEDIEVVPVRFTRPFGRLIAAAGRVGFNRALRLMARELEQK